jgi:hypothetical protein
MQSANPKLSFQGQTRCRPTYIVPVLSMQHLTERPGTLCLRALVRLVDDIHAYDTTIPGSVNLEVSGARSKVRTGKVNMYG